MRKVIECLWCKTNFEAYASQNRKFCTHQCSVNYSKKYSHLKTSRLIKCDTCNNSFFRAPGAVSKNNYCSVKCKNKGAVVPRIKLICSSDLCDTIFYKTQKYIDNSKNKKLFCSTSCAAKNGLLTIQLTKHKVKETKPELEFKELLEANNIPYIFQYAVPWQNGWKKWYDFYIPHINLLIEIDGIYWHGKGLLDEQLNTQQTQTRLNDQLKNELAKNSGYSLIRIWSDEINNFKFNKIKL